jgi:CO/xanthine dehydrogenase FAD-binding subunit
MGKIRYYEPTTLVEAGRMLLQEGSGAYLLAGGTDLMVRMRRRQWDVSTVVNLKRIPGLDGIFVDGDQLVIGALATLSDIERSPLIASLFPVLARAAYQMSSWPVRNIATAVGNICNASPAADMAPPLLCLNAEVVAAHAAGDRRTIPMGRFFCGPGRTSLLPGEIVMQIRVPLECSSYRSVYAKLGVRQALDIAITSVCVVARREKDSRLGDVRIALGSVAPVPMRAAGAEGTACEPEALEMAAEQAARECSPVDDVRATQWYRREMVKVLTRRCLQKLAQC